MSSNRPAIPRPLARAVFVEAGHRCAIPTCRSLFVLEIDHINDFAEVQEHRFENLIVLCANCHTMKTKGVIDRQAMGRYKANLADLNGRFTMLERRILDRAADRFRSGGEALASEPFLLPCYSELLVSELLGLGLLHPGEHHGFFTVAEGFNDWTSPTEDWPQQMLDPHIAESYKMTALGIEFVRRMDDFHINELLADMEIGSHE